jgi:hypothetical protein
MKKLYIEAYACSEYGSGPTYLELDVTQVVLNLIKHLQNVCMTHVLSEVHTNYVGGFKWGPAGEVEELELQLDELVVTQTNFWFAAVPRYSDWHVETRMQRIDDLIEGFKRPTEDLWIMSNDPSLLAELSLEKVV